MLAILSVIESLLVNIKILSVIVPLDVYIILSLLRVIFALMSINRYLHMIAEYLGNRTRFGHWKLVSICSPKYY
jgi:hypothetical protein